MNLTRLLPPMTLIFGLAKKSWGQLLGQPCSFESRISMLYRGLRRDFNSTPGHFQTKVS